MKRIVVFGGAGKTGQEVVKQAVDRGYKVRAFDVRRGNLPAYENMNFIEASVLDLEEVEKAVRGCSAVISELGVKLGSKKPLVSKGNKIIVEAMKKVGVKRLITQSAFGALESKPKLPWYLAQAAKTPLLQEMYADKDRMEKIVRDSKLDWTILRPVRLTNSTKAKMYRFGPNIPLDFNPRISRADIAHFILDELSNNNFVHQAVILTY